MSLRMRISLSAALLVLLVVGISAFFSYWSVSRAVEQGISAYSAQTATNTVAYVDINTYKKLLAHPEENEAYWTIRNTLNDVREKLGALYVYTLTVDGDALHIMVDGQPKHSKTASPIGEAVTATAFEDVAPALQGRTAYSGLIHDEKYGDYFSAFAPIKDENGAIIGVLGVDLHAPFVASLTQDILASNIPTFILSSLLLLAFSILLFMYVVQRSLRPLHLISKTAEKIANGDLTSTVEAELAISANRKDEVGQLAHSFQIMETRLSHFIRQVQHTVDHVAASSEQLAHATGQTEQASHQVATTMQEVAAGSVRQAEQTQHILQMMQNMTNHVHEAKAQADRNLDNTGAAVQISDEGKRAMDEAIDYLAYSMSTVKKAAETMQNLGVRSKEISTIITVITEISAQTNLLALNAAIEAARAGEHGRGFAVVADEVRKLAEETNQAAGKITGLIQSIQSETLETMTIIKQSEDAFEQQMEMIERGGIALVSIVERVKHTQEDSASMQIILDHVNAHTQQVFHALEEISSIIEEASSASEQVSAAAEQQLATVEEMAASVAETGRLSHQLHAELRMFRIEQHV
ncbi:methyl-accepting chemotaxis protein [Aneurinibacillus sp. REN35]|uniref:methyl-accepting chemotaxis protein n=1 Tax=Aneurinibacillus sp. REN35 TaxID=3237286 RepID=UPI003529AF4B